MKPFLILYIGMFMCKYAHEQYNNYIIIHKLFINIIRPKLHIT